MLSASHARYAVKVVAAALVESLPITPGTETLPSCHNATLTFRLHRTHLTEPFGVSCAFGLPGRDRDACFLRSLTPSLASSSAVLCRLVKEGRPAAPDALWVVRVNGEVSPTEQRLATLMTEGRDVVLECAVANVAAAEHTAEGEARDAAEESVETSVPAKRGRKPKKKAAALVEEEEGQDGAVEEEEFAPVKKRRGRGPAKKKVAEAEAPPSRGRRVKRAQNTDSRAAVTDEAAGTPSFEEEEAADALGELAGSSEDDLTGEVMEALQSISPSSELPLKRRRRRTKAEMEAARSGAVTTKKGKASAVEKEEEEEEEEKGDAWFRKSKGSKKMKEEEAVAAVKGRRGRKPKVTATEGEEEEGEAVSTPAPPKRRGRPAKVAVKEAVKARQTRKAKADDDSMPATTTAAAAAAATAVEDVTEETTSASAATEEDGEDFAF